MVSFAKILVKMAIFIMVAFALASFFVVYPYMMEVKSRANIMLLQVAHDGYLNSQLRDLTLSEFRGASGILAKSTLTPEDVETAALATSFRSPNEVEITACYRQNYDYGGNCYEMTGITPAQAQAYVDTANATGVLPAETYLVDRDTPITVTIKTNFKVETNIFGKRLVAYLPMTVSSPGISIKDYRW